MSQPDDLLVISSTETGLAASGEIDAHTAPSLAAAIDAAGPHVDLDLSGVEFVDSSGLRVLIDAHQRLTDSGGGLRLVAISDAVRRLLEISGVSEYLGLDA
ncbi:MAG: STAS domain-containing protein [Acidimicrobiia bacterium]